VNRRDFTLALGAAVFSGGSVIERVVVAPAVAVESAFSTIEQNVVRGNNVDLSWPLLSETINSTKHGPTDVDLLEL
jgi:hypothetical protein